MNETKNTMVVSISLEVTSLDGLFLKSRQIHQIRRILANTYICINVIVKENRNLVIGVFKKQKRISRKNHGCEKYPGTFLLNKSGIF